MQGVKQILACVSIYSLENFKVHNNWYNSVAMKADETYLDKTNVSDETKLAKNGVQLNGYLFDETAFYEFSGNWEEHALKRGTETTPL